MSQEQQNAAPQGQLKQLLPIDTAGLSVAEWEATKRAQERQGWSYEPNMAVFSKPADVPPAPPSQEPAETPAAPSPSLQASEPASNGGVASGPESGVETEDLLVPEAPLPA